MYKESLSGRIKNHNNIQNSQLPGSILAQLQKRNHKVEKKDFHGILRNISIHGKYCSPKENKKNEYPVTRRNLYTSSGYFER